MKQNIQCSYLFRCSPMLYVFKIKMGIKFLLLFTKFCHCIHILILDVLIGKGFKINLPHEMNVYGNAASNINVMLCKIANSTIKYQSLRNKHALNENQRGFPVRLQRITCDDHIGMPSTDVFFMYCNYVITKTM